MSCSLGSEVSNPGHLKFIHQAQNIFGRRPAAVQQNDRSVRRFDRRASKNCGLVTMRTFQENRPFEACAIQC